MRLIGIRALGGLVAAVLALPAMGFDVEDQRLYATASQHEMLRIISTADANVFEPIIESFQKEHPDVSVHYTIASSTELMRALYEENAQFDLAISSAMDLQTKLANDGFAKTYRSEAVDALPKWAKWRGQLFAFTQEPAVLVISEAAFEGRAVPKTREALIQMLRDAPDEFEGRIGTYDVRKSGAGYLFATQDSRNTDSYWRLTEVMGRLNTRLYSGSGGMIEGVANGDLILAYNVVGSYAVSRLKDTPEIRIVPFEDYLSVMLRTALIPQTVQNEKAAGQMIDFLSGMSARPKLVERTNLPPINAVILNENSAAKPIRLGPGLLVFLDKHKKQTFLRSWVNSIEQK
jgi:iron(III) transport system substrate-binding protein